MTKCKECGKPHPFIDSNCLVWTCNECVEKREKENHLFEDGETVRIKETGEVVTVDHWWFATPSADVRIFRAQYNIVEHPGTWYAENELEKV